MAGRAGQLSPARAATRSTSSKDEWDGVVAERPIHLASPFPEPESDRIDRLRGRAGARLRARARAAGQCLRSGRRRMSPTLRRSGRKVVLASYTRGARERLARPARRPWPQGAEARRQLAGSARRQDPAGAARPAARPRLHHARRRRPHRAGHARRPARPPPQEAQGRRRLPRRAGDALARRPRRPRRPRHRPLRGADPDPGQQGAARLRRARICARRQALRAGREYRAAVAATAARARASRSTASAAKRGSGASRG